ncbi:MAG: crossover junction endodeoxyribonuclease RuvC [Prevotella sp.]|nr:crossover junction endodeoxyribonuclease RuvC [Prevotella sp.]
MKILSIDGSTKSTGWAVFDDETLLDHGCIAATSADLINRIHKMTDGLRAVLDKYPDIQKVVMEEVRPEQGLQNLATHRALMYLQAAIEFMIHDDYKKIKIETVYPSEWRKVCGIKTGKGVRRETLKPQDIAFVKNTYGIDVNDDVADAICIGHAWVQKNCNEINWG